MAQEGKPQRIVINMASDGTFEVFTDEPCEVYVVNDQCPGDRVYLLTSAHTVGGVDEQLKDDPVGSANDARHAAIANRITKGRRYLEPVK